MCQKESWGAIFATTEAHSTATEWMFQVANRMPPTGEGEDGIGGRGEEEWSGCVVRAGDPHR